MVNNSKSHFILSLEKNTYLAIYWSCVAAHLFLSLTHQSLQTDSYTSLVTLNIKSKLIDSR